MFSVNKKCLIIIKIIVVLQLFLIGICSVANAQAKQQGLPVEETYEVMVLEEEKENGSVSNLDALIEVEKAEIEVEAAKKEEEIYKKELELQKKKVVVEAKEAELAEKQALAVKESGESKKEIEKVKRIAKQEKEEVHKAVEKIEILEKKLFFSQKNARIAQEELKLTQKRATIAEGKIKDKQSLILQKVLKTGLVLFFGYLLLIFLIKVINKVARERKIKKLRLDLVCKSFEVLFLSIGAFAIIFIWGVNAENLWISLTSILGVLSIGLFAVWSILSNIIAGLFLFISDPFRIDDEIVILQDDIQGIVAKIKLMFVVLEDNEGNIIYIPSSIFFQKAIKRIKKDTKRSSHIKTDKDMNC